MQCSGDGRRAAFAGRPENVRTEKRKRQEEKMSIKGIVFDFNGTMYIDGDKQEAAWFEFFQRHADGKYTVRQLHKMIHGINEESF